MESLSGHVCCAKLGLADLASRGPAQVGLTTQSNKLVLFLDEEWYKQIFTSITIDN